MATPTPTSTRTAAGAVVEASGETTHGKTVINDNVVAKIAGIAARDVKGVHALGGGTARMIGAIRDAMNNTDLGQGVSVEVGETQVAVDISFVADYPVALQKIADEVRAEIIKAISTLVGMEVTEVNITINDVYIASDDDDDDDDQGHESQARVQ